MKSIQLNYLFIITSFILLLIIIIILYINKEILNIKVALI
jgi:hypothetical protein